MKDLYSNVAGRNRDSMNLIENYVKYDKYIELQEQKLKKYKQHKTQLSKKIKNLLEQHKKPIIYQKYKFSLEKRNTKSISYKKLEVLLMR